MSTSAVPTIKISRVVCLLTALAISAFGGAARAQGTDPKEGDPTDPQELMRQIHRNMDKIEEELSKLRAQDPGAPGSEAAGEHDRTIDTLKRRQDQVVKDIDEVIKQMKASNDGPPSSQPPPKDGKPKSGNQPPPKSRDRNKSDKQDGKDQPPNGQKPKGKQDQKKPGDKKPGDKKPGGKDPKDDPKDGKDPKEGGESHKPGEQRQDGTMPDSPRERVVLPNLHDRWGTLPPEVRQKLVDRNFSDFTPEYQDEVKEYLKRTNVIPKTGG